MTDDLPNLPDDKREAITLWVKSRLEESEKAHQDRIELLRTAGEHPSPIYERFVRLAGELGLLGVPIFIFHEGRDRTAAAAFKQIASLSRGAYLSFDLSSADRLKELLAAVAVYAAGGYRALTAYGEKKGGEILRLTAQLRE